ncbi:class I SAM-dependent methyltransferase [Mesonia sp. K4-1]|uniref:class I SAM-dependent methyltransferase n=1 Tax=Mesonia sp. K4-1 TaxID=2602760 RepID=UPI0011C89D03|nr:class I SAM-dependent methyltransferase [Mesonia sp. K4-1]TXK78534.1 class I SAM-dependent methyltransferase [Mesonia sp. K4-1]
MEKTTEVYLSCKDYTVSQKEFQLIWNAEKDILITHPQPSLEELPSYYKSEDYISHTDSSKSLFDKAYQSVKKMMLVQKLKLINSFATEEKTILDIGAGTGDFLQYISKHNWRVSGVEPNEKARNLAKSKNLNLLRDLSSFNNEKFDVITLWHVLEHIPNLKEQIEQFHHLLKPNGVLVIAVPNFESYDAKYYKEYWAAYDVPRHLWHFSKKGIKRLFTKYNFVQKSIHPLWFDSFYVSLLSEKYRNKSPNYFKAFKVGLKSNFKAKTIQNYSSHIYTFQKAK